jgi:membrane-associated phospholipid phosphatase
MRIRRLVVGMTAMVTLASPAAAQSVGNMLKDDFKYAGKDIGAVWLAPFNASGKDWATFAGAMGLFGATMLIDQQASDWALRTDSAGGFKVLSELRRGGVLFTGKYVVPPVAAMYVAGIVFKKQGLRDAVMGCAASWIAQSPPRRALAKVIGRARPDTTKDDPSRFEPNDPQIWEIGWKDDWNMRSFPGGHIANVMGCASFWANRFDLGGVGEVALYAVATGVGVGRMADAGHWASDQVIGAILGYAIGKEIARRQLSRLAPPSGATGLNVSPGANGTMLTFSWTF